MPPRLANSISSHRATAALRGRRARPRRGIEVLEVIIALPVMIIITLALFEFGMLMVVDQTVVSATTKGAREAGKGANILEVADVVNQLLAVHSIAITPTSTTGNIVLEVGGQPTTTINGNPCTPPASPSLGTDEVRVTVCVDLTYPPVAGETPPVPDALATFGFTLNGRHLQSSTLVKKE